jgi:hypothetical protein
MAVGLKVVPIFYKIGTGNFFNSFFSTVTYHLEKSKRGSKFPYLMKNLYQVELLYNDISNYFYTSDGEDLLICLIEL